MQIKTFKECLPYLIESNIVPMLVGHHGVGKSQSISQFCNENKYMLVDLRLGTQDVGDLIGLGDFGIENGEKVSTNFMPPNWAFEVNRYCTENPDSKAIIFLDEMNRATRDVLQAIFQLVLDKRMHSLQLPDNVFIIAAMNPNTEDYIVTDLSDKALIDRFCHIKLSPTVGEWLEYGRNSKFDADVIDFINNQRELLRERGEDFSLDYVKPTPRSWEAVSRLKLTNIPQKLLQELCTGIVGSAATAAFITHLNNSDKPFSAKDILDGYSKIKKKVETFSDHETETKGRMDLIKSTCDNVLDYLKKNSKKLTKKQSDNLIKFLLAIPNELSWDFTRQAYPIEKHRDILANCKELKTKLAKARNMEDQISSK